MSGNQVKRLAKELTSEESARLQQQRACIAEELPELVHRDQMRKEAQEEQTLSGEFRRAVHASELSLPAIASQAGIKLVLLDEFLTGERTLRSDVMDRLAMVLGFRFEPVESSNGCAPRLGNGQ